MQINKHYPNVFDAIPGYFQGVSLEWRGGVNLVWFFQYDQEQHKYTFTAKLDEIYAKQHWLEIGGYLNAGYFVELTDSRFLPEPVVIRIVGVKEYVNKPQQPELTISNETTGKGIGIVINSLRAKDQVIDRKSNEVEQFSRRRWNDLKQTTDMLTDALSGYGESISPITVQTMQLIVGDESLQFRFVDSKTDPQQVTHVVTYNADTKILSCPTGILQHMTLGLDMSSSHAADEYQFWDAPAYVSPVLPDASKSYYLYVRASKTDQTAIFLLSETAIKMEAVAGYYHFLMGILNSEFDNDRSYASMYGYTEVLPGRITVDKIVSPDGKTYFDVQNGVIAGTIRFASGNNTYDVADEFDTVNENIENIEVGGRNYVRNSNTIIDLSGGTYLTDEFTSNLAGKQAVVSYNIRKTLANSTTPCFVNSVGTRVGDYIEVVSGLISDFERHSIVVTVPEGAVKLRLGPYASFRLIKVEIGNKATDWTPAPEDDISAINTAQSTANLAQTAATNASNTANEAQTTANEANASVVALEYLKVALVNETTIQGGLVSTSLIKVGAVNSSGSWVEKAGINGAGSGDNTVRIYAGGTLTEANRRVSGVSGTKAGFVVTDGGSVYAVKGLIGGWTLADDKLYGGSNLETGTILSPNRIDIKSYWGGDELVQLNVEAADQWVSNVKQVKIKGTYGSGSQGSCLYIDVTSSALASSEVEGVNIDAKGNAVGILINSASIAALIETGSVTIASGDVSFRNLPTSNSGLTTSRLWRDSNGYLRIV